MLVKMTIWQPTISIKCDHGLEIIHDFYDGKYFYFNHD
jgi:hypothetical protein